MSHTLLFCAWGFVAVLFLGITIWLLIAGDSITAEMRRKQPHAVVSFAGNTPQDTAMKATDLPVVQKDELEKKDPGRRIVKPGAPASDQAKLERNDKPLVRQDVQKSTLHLHPHPDPQLVEKAALGPLPVIGKDGRQAWQVYARPFSKLNKRPRIAVVFTGLGVSANATESVIQNITGSISLAIAPFARRLKEWIKISRAAGHEVLVGLPMEPVDYPVNDPGPYTLLTSLPEDQNKQRIHWVLSRLTGYVGVSTFMASKFSTKPDKLRPVILELKSRGLMLLDVRENPLSSAMGIARKVRMPAVARDLFVDGIATRENIRARLAQAEQIAKSRGHAVAIARPYPVSVTEFARWAKEVRSRGVTLAPVSAVAQLAAQ